MRNHSNRLSLNKKRTKTRNEVNEIEKLRTLKINYHITSLRNVLEMSNIPTKRDKYSVLKNTQEYLLKLQHDLQCAEEQLSILSSQIGKSETSSTSSFQNNYNISCRVPMIIGNESGTILSCNDDFCRLSGISRDEILKISFHQFIPTEEILQLTREFSHFSNSSHLNSHSQSQSSTLQSTSAPSSTINTTTTTNGTTTTTATNATSMFHYGLNSPLIRVFCRSYNFTSNFYQSRSASNLTTSSIMCSVTLWCLQSQLYYSTSSTSTPLSSSELTFQALIVPINQISIGLPPSSLSTIFSPVHHSQISSISSPFMFPTFQSSDISDSSFPSHSSHIRPTSIHSQYITSPLTSIHYQGYGHPYTSPSSSIVLPNEMDPIETYNSNNLQPQQETNRNQQSNHPVKKLRTS